MLNRLLERVPICSLKVDFIPVKDCNQGPKDASGYDYTNIVMDEVDKFLVGVTHLSSLVTWCG